MPWNCETKLRAALPHPPRTEHWAELGEPSAAEVELVDDRADARDLPPPIGRGAVGVRIAVNEQHWPRTAVVEPLHQLEHVRAVGRVRRPTTASSPTRRRARSGRSIGVAHAVETDARWNSASAVASIDAGSFGSAGWPTRVGR